MINFEALRKTRERMEDSLDGKFGRCGNWMIALGGYDMGYEVYYKGQSVMRVNYELNKYEFYSCDYSDVLFTQDTIPQIKKVLEITPRFDNVGDIDDNGDYIDEFGQYVNGVEANVSESGGTKMKFKKVVKEETILEMEDADYGIAGGICSELLDEIGVSDGASVLDVVANALKINPYGTEVNGDLVEDVTHDGLIHTFGSSKNKHYLLSDDVKWLRVEHYAKETKTPAPCIMYVYIHKKPDSDAFDMDNVQFDYYPDPETDDYVDGVQYRDCVRHMGVAETTRRQNMKFKKVVKEYGRKVYPAANGCTINDMGDCLIVTNKDGLNIGQCRTMIEAEVIADEAEERTKMKLGLESTRKQIMWAINYRDMHTAIHGLYYAKERKLVEEFYEALKSVLDERNPEYADDPELREIDYQNICDEFYSRGIREIDEINFRDIGKLPSGKYGIVIDGVEYRMVNNVSMDIYEESTRKQKMKFKKIVKEADEQNHSDAPAVYVGTYGKYADGSLKGEWVKLTDFNTYDDFMDYIRELHKDESDPEFMFQDYENFPSRWYSESGISDVNFYKILEWYELDDERRGAYEAYLEAGLGDDIESFENAYEGQHDSKLSFTEYLVDSIGWDGVGEDNLQTYFDFDAFGRDLMFDYHMGDEGETDADGEPQDPEHYYNQDGYDMGEYEDDAQVGQDFVDSMGGLDQLGEETLERYFDYDAFARDLFIGDYTYYDGYVFSDY